MPLPRDQLIEALHDIQDAQGEIATQDIRDLAAAARLSVAEVFEVASFYRHFKLGSTRCEIQVCEGVPCQLRGGRELLAAAREALGEFGVGTVACLGRCDAAPAAWVGRQAVTSATVARLREALGGGTVALTPCPQQRAEYESAGGYRVLRGLRAGEHTAEAITTQVEAAGLRGLGGALFPVAAKWRAVRSQPPPRLMVVNADESEPGTFKDRWCLERRPHQFLEGLLIAATVVGAERVWIFLREEYHFLREVILSALADCPVSAPPIALRRGAGAYVCGEESALIEALEGKRGLPRQKPPYVASRGLFGRPTLVHNVETLYRLPPLLGAGSSGVRAYCVSGRVAQPGVVEAGFDASPASLVEAAGGLLPGHRLQAVCVGGASGGLWPAAHQHRPLMAEGGSGALIVLSQADDVREVAADFMRFFARESCGQCTPCRVGTAHAAGLMQQPRWPLVDLSALADCLADASICGLGQAAAQPIRSVLRHFPKVVS